MKKLIGSLALLLFVGCAGTTQYVPLPNESNVVDDPSKGRVYIVRPTMFGMGVPMKVLDEGKQIATTYGKSYVSWEREPGNHVITGKAENTEDLSLFVKQGQRVYVKQGVEMGIIMARNSLTPIDEQTAKEYMAKMKSPKVELKK